MILEQHVALLLQRRLDHSREHAEHRRQQDPEADLVVHHVDGGGDRLAHRGDVEVELVAGPAGLHLSAAGDLLFELVNIVGDPAPGLVLAEAVREIHFDGLTHSWDVARGSALFKLPHASIILAMKILALPLLLAGSLAAAQPTPVSPPTPPPAAAPWNPAAPYITAGQDEPGYRSWYMAAPWRAAQVKAFNDYL